MGSILKNASVRLRLSLLIAVTVMAIGSLITATYLTWEWNERKDELATHARWMSTNLAMVAAVPMAEGNSESVRSLIESMARTEKGIYGGLAAESMEYLEVMDGAGNTVVSSSEGLDEADMGLMGSMRESAACEDGICMWNVKSSEGCGLYGASSPIFLKGERLGTVNVGICDAPARREMTAYIWQSAVLVGLAGLLSVLMAGRIAGWFSKPVTLLVEGVGNLSIGNLDYRVEIDEPREMRLLAGSFNSMAQTLKEKMERLERAKEEAVDLNARLTDSLAEAGRVTHKLQEANDWMAELAGRVDETNRQLKAEKYQTETIVHSMKEGLVALDINERIILMNPEAEEIFGLRYDEVRGEGVRVLFDSLAQRTDDPDALIARLEAATRSPESESVFNITLTRPYQRVLRRRSSAIRDEAGQVTGRVVVFSDMSREKEVDDMKTNFVAIVSHELRTPLTSIKGALSLMADGHMEDTAAMEEFLSIAEQNTDRLINLITNLLDLSKMESGTLALKVEKLDINALIGRQVRSAGLLAREKGLTIETRLNEDAAGILGDREKLEQVLANVLGNAVKFSPDGGRVEVSTSTADDEIRITVQDEGFGIPPDKLGRVFEKFYQVDMSATRVAGGTGLGLSICKAIVAEHGGRIWAESPVTPDGRGARIVVSLPRAGIASGVRLSPVRRSPVRRPAGWMGEQFTDARDTVLIVDADPMAAKAQSARFLGEGYRAIHATSGRDALRLAREVRPGFIFLDVELPDLSGLDVASILKKDAETRDIPIVFAAGPGHEANSALSSLGSGFIIKPYDDHELVSTVRQYFGNAAGAA